MKLLSHISCNAVIQDKNDNYLKKINPVSLDFSAIAKGYAVDELAILLLSDPTVKGFMIDVGGELQINGESTRTYHGQWAFLIRTKLDFLFTKFLLKSLITSQWLPRETIEILEK